jgi:hypothetical protein
MRSPSPPALARPGRIVLVAAGLYLVAALWWPLRVDLTSPVDGVFFEPPAANPDAGAVRSLVEPLRAARLLVERSWIESPFEVNGRAEISFDLYQRERRELLLRAEGRTPQLVALSLRANQMTLPATQIGRSHRFQRWNLPPQALRIGRNSFVIEIRDSAGRPAGARISWLRVNGAAPTGTRSVPQAARASLENVELPAVVQKPGTCLALELDAEPQAHALELSIGTYGPATSLVSHLSFHVLARGDRDQLVPLFSRRFEVGTGSVRWHPTRIGLLEDGGPPRQLLFVVEGRASPDQLALWGDPRLMP